MVDAAGGGNGGCELVDMLVWGLIRVWVEQGVTSAMEAAMKA